MRFTTHVLNSYLFSLPQIRIVLYIAFIVREGKIKGREYLRKRGGRGEKYV